MADFSEMSCWFSGGVLFQGNHLTRSFDSEFQKTQGSAHVSCTAWATFEGNVTSWPRWLKTWSTQNDQTQGETFTNDFQHPKLKGFFVKQNPWGPMMETQRLDGPTSRSRPVPVKILHCYIHKIYISFTPSGFWCQMSDSLSKECRTLFSIRTGKSHPFTESTWKTLPSTSCKRCSSTNSDLKQIQGHSCIPGETKITPTHAQLGYNSLKLTAIAPENGWLEDEFPFWDGPILRTTFFEVRLLNSFIYISLRMMNHDLLQIHDLFISLGGGRDGYRYPATKYLKMGSMTKNVEVWIDATHAWLMPLPREKSVIAWPTEVPKNIFFQIFPPQYGAFTSMS